MNLLISHILSAGSVIRDFINCFKIDFYDKLLFMKPNFFDCINNQDYKLTNFCDNYLYLDLMSNKLGYHKYVVYQEKNDVIKLKKTDDQPHQWKAIAKTIVKILSYIIFPILPIAALIVKAINRNKFRYEIVQVDDKVQNAAKLIANDPPIENKKPNNIALIDPLNEEQDIKIPENIPPKFDIRGNIWLSHDGHIWIYSRFLELSYPTLFVPGPFDYTIKKTMYPMGESTPIENVILSSLDETNERGLDKTVLSIPLHVSKNHWTLVLVDRKKRSIEYYDSKKDYGNHDEIIDHLKGLEILLTEKDPGETPYTFSCKIEKELQPDGYQCGVWILYFLENRLKNPNVNFNDLNVQQAQKMIANYRLKIIDGFFKWRKHCDQIAKRKLAQSVAR